MLILALLFCKLQTNMPYLLYFENLDRELAKLLIHFLLYTRNSQSFYTCLFHDYYFSTCNHTLRFHF